MKEPPVLVPPQLKKPFKLYVEADTQTIGSTLIQEFEGKERIVTHLSRKLLDPKKRYSVAEKLLPVCLLLMYKVSVLFVECRMRCIFKVLCN
jgi:hypothetical protein